MSEEYDCTEDVLRHKQRVAWFMRDIAELIKNRARCHDDSKLKDPAEKALFDKWTPELKERTFGTDYYKQALDEMGEGVKLHYKANRHHPEHYDNGIDDMTFEDVIEMFCDWCAAASLKDVPLDLDHAKERFGISDQLFNIMLNTLKDNDFWYAINNVPMVFLTPEKYRK